MTSDTAAAAGVLRDIFDACAPCGANAALQATPSTSHRHHPAHRAVATSLGEVLGKGPGPAHRRSGRLQNAAMLDCGAGAKLIGRTFAASVLAKLDKGWRECVTGVSSGHFRNVSALL